MNTPTIRAFPTRTFVAGELTGEYHDASMCTFDGRALVVASICRGSHILDTNESSTPEVAEAWIRRQLRQRTGAEANAVELDK